MSWALPMDRIMRTARLSLRTLCIAAVLAAGLPAAAAEADADPERTAARMITPEADQSIERGIAFLISRQRDDGSLGSAAYRGNVAVAALGGMAWMAGGSTPGRGPHGAQVSLCLDYLLANTDQSGFISAHGRTSHGPMYGHGFATLFLAECYGMSKRPELREKLAAAVELIVNTQNHEGGWRYYPQRLDADISVTICQVMALRAAKNAGVHVPKETIDRCIQYVKQSQNDDGGFRYMLPGGESSFARSAAGVVALYSAGVYESPEITKGLKYLVQYCPEPGVQRRELPYYYYGHYYAVQAMWHAGGEDWSRWYPAVRDELIAKQQPDGSWQSSMCLEYSTAMACIVLQMPDNCLPIFQR
ncbi:MAG: terpene cyclase/mutase family protein [Pirellulales bacterium]|nr:terpene cyclase/mutase family protein [Pirellulales bacterium]